MRGISSKTATRFAAFSNFAIAGLGQLGLALGSNSGVSLADSMESLADGALHLSASKEHNHSLRAAIRANMVITVVSVLYEVFNSKSTEVNGDLANMASITTLGVSGVNMGLFAAAEQTDSYHHRIAKLHASSDMIASSITATTNYLSNKYPGLDLLGILVAGSVRTGFSLRQHRILSNSSEHHHGHDEHGDHNEPHTH